MTPDPLVALWGATSRPLNWRRWQQLTDAEQARMRWLLMDELQWIEIAWPHTCHWRQTHRQLLEVKAAAGHEAIRVTV